MSHLRNVRSVLPLLASLLLAGTACGPMDEAAAGAPEDLEALEQPLSVFKTVTEGDCETTASIVRNSSGAIVGRCSTQCDRDGTVTIRMYVSEIRSNGTKNQLGFDVVGASAETGGSTYVAISSLPTGSYETACWIDYSDDDRNHSSAWVYAGPTRL